MPKKFRNGFTLIEVLVVIAVIGVLAAILIPVLGSVRERAKVSTSTSNLRQIGAAMHLFANDNGDRFPALNDTAQGAFGQVWFVAIMPYLVDITKNASEMSSAQLTDVYRCSVWQETYTPTAASDWNQLGYGMSFRMVFESGWPYDGAGTGAQDYAAPRSQIRNPGKTVMVGPSPSWNLNFERNQIDAHLAPQHGVARARRHGDFAVYLMADGSVRQLEARREVLLQYVAN